MVYKWFITIMDVCTIVYPVNPPHNQVGNMGVPLLQLLEIKYNMAKIVTAFAFAFKQKLQI